MGVAGTATRQELIQIESECSLRREGSIGLSGRCSLVRGVRDENQAAFLRLKYSSLFNAIS
jgi:hypothetical protein